MFSISCQLDAFIYDVAGITNKKFPYCLVARISRSHREGPGSIPGGGELFDFFIYLNL